MFTVAGLALGIAAILMLTRDGRRIAVDRGGLIVFCCAMTGTALDLTIAAIGVYPRL